MLQTEHELMRQLVHSPTNMWFRPNFNCKTLQKCAFEENITITYVSSEKLRRPAIYAASTSTNQLIFRYAMDHASASWIATSAAMNNADVGSLLITTRVKYCSVLFILKFCTKLETILVHTVLSTY